MLRGTACEDYDSSQQTGTTPLWYYEPDIPQLPDADVYADFTHDELIEEASRERQANLNTGPGDGDGDSDGDEGEGEGEGEGEDCPGNTRAGTDADTRATGHRGHRGLSE